MNIESGPYKTRIIGTTEDIGQLLSDAIAGAEWSNAGSEGRDQVSTMQRIRNYSALRRLIHKAEEIREQNKRDRGI